MKVIDWRPLRKGSLIGFARVEQPSGLIIHDITICESNGRIWASPPGRPKLNKDGTALGSDTSKFDYLPMITFASRQVRDQWSHAVIEALRRDYPEALS